MSIRKLFLYIYKYFKAKENFKAKCHKKVFELFYSNVYSIYSCTGYDSAKIPLFQCLTPYYLLSFLSYIIFY